MKIQLDTTAKVIRVEEAINLGEFFKALRNLLPNNLWKEYALEVNTVINWTYPIIPYYPTVPTYPWLEPIVTCDTHFSDVDSPSTALAVETGIYNIEI